MNKFYFPILLLFLFFSSACKKDKYVANGTATLNVINGVIRNNVLIKVNGSINTSGANSSNNQQNMVRFNSNAFFYAEAKNTTLDILNYSDSLSLASKNFDLKKGGVYSLLLTGVFPDVDPILVDDSDIPVVDNSKIPSDADSVINIRFINLCPDLQPLDIRLKGSSSNEFSGVAYKGYTPFKSFPGKIETYAGSLGYNLLSFEIFENGNLIRPHDLYVFYTNRFKSISLVLTGLKNPGPGQPSMNITTMNYFQ